MEKRNLFLADGTPRYIRVYDNQGESFDQFTIIFSKLGRAYGYPYVGSSTYPISSQGFYQHGESADGYIDRPSYKHLGKKIKFSSLPEQVQKAVMSDYKNYWRIKN
jgi:hypothetical protein